MIGQTNKQTNRDYNFDYILAWEPSSAKVTKSSSIVYPHLNDLPGNKIFPIKVDPLNLESQIQSKNIPVGLPSSPNQKLR